MTDSTRGDSERSKTQARHALDLIVDYHESHDDLGRAGVATRATDADLLDVIKDVLFLLTVTSDAYVNEKGSERQRDEIARLHEELTHAKGPQTDLLARANKRIGELQQELDERLVRDVARTHSAAADAQDAERYRWLRDQHWSSGPLAVVSRPKDAVKLGHDCPNGARLDYAIDTLRSEG